MIVPSLPVSAFKNKILVLLLMNSQGPIPYSLFLRVPSMHVLTPETSVTQDTSTICFGNLLEHVTWKI